MSTHQTLHDIDHCRLEVIDEILGTLEVFDIPTTVAEASHNSLEVERARFWLKWFGRDDEPLTFDDPDNIPEPLSVCVIRRSDSIVVRWFAVGPHDLAVERRREILNGQWLRKGVTDDE